MTKLTSTVSALLLLLLVFAFATSIMPSVALAEVIAEDACNHSGAPFVGEKKYNYQMLYNDYTNHMTTITCDRQCSCGVYLPNQPHTPGYLEAHNRVYGAAGGGWYCSKCSLQGGNNTP